MLATGFPNLGRLNRKLSEVLSLLYVQKWKFIYKIIHSGWSLAWICMKERVNWLSYHCRTQKMTLTKTCGAKYSATPIMNWIKTTVRREISRLLENILIECRRLLYSKSWLKQPLSKRPKIGFQDQLSLNAGQNIAVCSRESILQYFQPASSYHLSLRSLFCLFFEWPLKTGFTVYIIVRKKCKSLTKKK